MLSAALAPTPLFLDGVEAPRNFNPAPAPFALVVQELFLRLEAVCAANKAPFGSVGEKKSHVIAQFVHTWRTHFGSDIYPAARLVLPHRDPRRYHVQDGALTRLVVRLLRLQKGLADHDLVAHWRRDHHHKARLAGRRERRGTGDFPLLVLRLVQRRRDPAHPVASSVSVADVNAALDAAAGLRQATEQAAALAPLVARMTVAEVRVFFGILLQQPMLSFYERSFFDAWHADAYALAQVCGDLATVLWALADPRRRFSAAQLCVQPMHQFVPQALHKLTVSYAELCRKMAQPLVREGRDPGLVRMYDAQRLQGRFLIEEKIDGDRMLMHMAGGRFRWHTRRRRDYTPVYGETTHGGSLAPHLGGAFADNVHSVVLDGEMVAWSSARQCVLPFGSLRSAAVHEALKQRAAVDVYAGNDSWPMYIVFDIVHLNGRDLTRLPLFYRKSVLLAVVREVPRRLEVLRWIKAAGPADIEANMRRIVCANNEGIMVKSLLLKYRVHSRDLTWIKVKPEYLESFGENLDLVVIGKTGRVKTAYFCGLRDDAHGGTHKLFCAVANGFSAAVYRHIESALGPFWQDHAACPPPPDVVQFGAKKPAFWVHPAHLVVLEIKARSVDSAAGSSYAAGSTLHNLWCRAVRDDKSYDECLSLQDYHELRRRHSRDPGKPQRVNRDRRLDHADSIYQKYAVAGPPPPLPAANRSELFAGLVLVVATDSHDPATGVAVPAADTRRVAASHGADVWLDVRPDDLRVLSVLLVGEVATPRVRRWIADGFDVLRPRWVHECVRRGRLVPLEPQYVFCANSAAFQRALGARVDVFGDSYTEGGVSSSGFLAYLAGLPVDSPLSAGQSEFEDRQSEFEPEAEPIADAPALFRGASFYVVPAPGLAGSAEQARIQRRIERFAGRVAPGPVGCGYIVMPQSLVDSGSAQQAQNEVRAQIARSFGEHSRLAYIVAERFLRASIDAGELADPALFGLDG
ncbi:hypothetical protein METBIDRAFT_40642 [Metschnikowia bicuspidata var. bicuspidata NRRL YB-4993]|uniref:DNA ligase 4 n=1 Tax=Metschnikowia bicuspidata var. bicuspidata NRRL YB-4993 TaxID=869754 RepID=A0A1A0HDJ5_9ASCO|nr:hypothetical protein METBIDRAFT_40642 [Metschnikowia bicuspidata var. bicuspidata NRRL YB-4993]OBA21998.1 hypothetical protein METBIDRAFT_40642 [Metschnikowia bicuspidata var. bicuspidata NRRL YB-4993]